MSLLMRSSMMRRATRLVHASPVASFQNNARFFSAVPKLSNPTDPTAVIDDALKTFGDDIAISFSGAEDVILVDLASRTGRPFRVFSLDTGRLNPETYELFRDVEEKYGINIEYTFPDAKAVEDLVGKKGQFSFRKDGHGECCGVRKVAPLVKKLSTLRAWITGQRKDQSPDTRAAVPAVQEDPVFKGVDGALVKFNPVTGMTSAEVWNHIRSNGVPYNKLHEQGMISIGCAPCTRSILPGQHEREGRWWWESAKEKECGLHEGNKEDFKPKQASA